MTGDLRIDVLGPVRVRLDGAAVPVPGRRRRLVLALLAAERGRTVPVARLVDALWDGAAPAPDDPVNTVQQYVAALRRVLRGDAGTSAGSVLRTAPPGYRLDLPPGSTDTDTAADAVTVSRSLLRDGQPAAARQAARRALDLWRGTPFEEFAAHPHLQAAVRQARRLRLDVVEAWAAAAQAEGDHHAVVALLGDDPSAWYVREPLAVHLVTALAAAGRSQQALQVAAARRTWAEQHAAPVGRALREVEAQVAAGRVPRPVAGGALPAQPDPAAERLRRLAATAPVLTRPDGDRQATEALDYHLALALAANDPALSADRAEWLQTFERHHAGLAASVAWATHQHAEAGVDLACELALWWDWTDRRDALRRAFGELLAVLPGDADRARGRAATWLAYSSGPADPARALQLAVVAVTALREHPHELGKARAVEAVVSRGRHPARATAAAEAAVRLLGEHGTARELAYARVTAALSALSAGDRSSAERHVAAAGDLYRGAGDPRGPAWLDAVEARLQQREATTARAFHRRLGDAATGSLLQGT